MTIATSPPFLSGRPSRLPRIRFWLTGLLALSLALQGCAGGNTSRQARSEAEWRFAKDAITLHITAGADLNFASNEPHTLVLAVFQMRDAAAFRKLLTDPAALGDAFEGTPTGESFLRVTRYVITPGRRAALTLDRVENARAIGIAAGYFQFDAANAARLFEVPVVVTRKGWFAHTYEAAPGPLALRLDLGALAITRAEVQDRPPAPASPDDGKAGKDGEISDRAAGNDDTVPLKQL